MEGSGKKEMNMDLWPSNKSTFYHCAIASEMEKLFCYIGKISVLKIIPIENVYFENETEYSHLFFPAASKIGNP